MSRYLLTFLVWALVALPISAANENSCDLSAFANVEDPKRVFDLETPPNVLAYLIQKKHPGFKPAQWSLARLTGFVESKPEHRLPIHQWGRYNPFGRKARRNREFSIGEALEGSVKHSQLVDPLTDPKIRDDLRDLGARGPAVDEAPVELVSKLITLVSRMDTHEWQAAEKVLSGEVTFERTEKEIADGTVLYPLDDRRPNFLKELLEKTWSPKAGLVQTTNFDDLLRSNTVQEFFKILLDEQYLDPTASYVLSRKNELDPPSFNSNDELARALFEKTDRLLLGALDKMSGQEIGVALHVAGRDPSLESILSANFALSANRNLPASATDEIRELENVHVKDLLALDTKPQVLKLAEEIVALGREYAKAHEERRKARKVVNKRTKNEDSDDENNDSVHVEVPDKEAEIDGILARLPELVERPEEPNPGKLGLTNEAAELDRFFQELNRENLESEELLQYAKMTLIARGTMNMEGTPGTGKTQAAELLKKVSSFYGTQATSETAADQLFGPLKPKSLFEENKYERMLEGFGAKVHYLFVDEAGDLRPDARRMLLGLMNERRVSIGGDTVDALLKAAMLATNQSRFEITHRTERQIVSAKPDRGADAYYDRVWYHFYVADEFQKMSSYTALLNRRNGEDAASEIKQEDVGKLQDRVKDVEIPLDIQIAATSIFRQMKDATQEKQKTSKTEYLTSIAEGKVPEPYYIPTRIYSKRSARLMGPTLRASIVLDATIARERSLVADLEDLHGLRFLFAMGNEDQQFTKESLDRTEDSMDRATAQASHFENMTFNSITQDFRRNVANHEETQRYQHLAAVVAKGELETRAAYAAVVRDLINLVDLADAIKKEHEAGSKFREGTANDVAKVATLRAGRKALELLRKLPEPPAKKLGEGE